VAQLRQENAALQPRISTLETELANLKGRTYAHDSQLTGVASPITFLRLNAVQMLAEIGRKEDAPFIANLDAKAEGEHPLFDEECGEAIKKLQKR